MLNSDSPLFSVQGPRLKVRKPSAVIDAAAVSQEAFIEIDSTGMSQEFLLKLMYHIGQGSIRVKIAEVSHERI